MLLSRIFIQYLSCSSGVARIPCALEQEIFLRSQSTKTAEFEVKIWYKSAEEASIEAHLTLERT